jgi:site-specific DNA-methyltransferase (adenine-specific)
LTGTDGNGRARRPRTSTSNFGVSRRESHDASAFYDRFATPTLTTSTDLGDHAQRDLIWCGDARHMDVVGDIADDSVALVVTSPPYFAGKEYEEALGAGHIPASYAEYLQMLHHVFAECVRKLEPGGRIAVNVANLGRKPYRSLSADVIGILQDLGLLLRGEIIWFKQRAAGGSCAWGTYQRPGNPVLRDLTERIVIASKGRFDRALTPAERARDGWPSDGSMFMDDFVDATTDVWEIPAESATRVGHPAPFPVELPRRLIELYTYRDDLILDPFMGSGSTAVAAVRTGRHFVGFDTDQGYVARASERIQTEVDRLCDETRHGDEVPLRAIVPAIRSAESSTDDDPADFQARSVRQGRKAKELALAALEWAGFTEIEPDRRYPAYGVEVNFRAIDKHGDPWLFDVSGAFSSTRPGLKRTDTLWKALGKALVLQAGGLGRLVLLSTDLPPPNSAGDRALAAVRGSNKAVHDVICLRNIEQLERLRDLASGPRPRR